MTKYFVPWPPYLNPGSATGFHVDFVLSRRTQLGIYTMEPLGKQKEVLK